MMNRFFTLLLAASCLTAVGQVESVCGCESENSLSVNLDLVAPEGFRLGDVLFASYGTPAGDCDEGFALGECHATNSISVIEGYISDCAESLSVYPSNSVFGDPCIGTVKTLCVKIALEAIVSGCLNVEACNFNSEATCDDGSCLHPDACGECGGDGTSGCTDSYACNFDADAACDEGNCDYSCCPGPGCCGEGMFWDWNIGECAITNPADINFDGCVQLGDLLDLLTAYGDCGSSEWQCGDPLEYQGYDYETVQIGEQCWFAENLRAENYRNGDAITSLAGTPNPFASGDCDLYYSGEGLVGIYGNSWGCLSDCSGSFDACSDLEATLVTFGLVYNEYAVSDSRNLCPIGWHESTDEDWMTLEVTLGMPVSEAESTGGRGQIAPLLKSEDLWCEDNPGGK
jgi:uncharacterized protein (TIGR02145 family)